MKTVLLAGGLGTRLREETEFKPKPMVEVGAKPMLWHIMKLYEYAGFNDFIICAGYKSEVIKQYFSNSINLTGDFKVRYSSNNSIDFLGGEIPDWSVLVSDTGYETMTGGRIKRVQKYIGNERFFCTYGDGLSNVDIKSLLDSHISSKKLATVTAVHPTSRFGQLKIDNKGQVFEFNEKPLNDEWINGGFFVFEPEVFSFLEDDHILEKDLLPTLAMTGQLNAFMHEGFWQPMDTFRESQLLNQLWATNKAPWKVWQV
jgi:glucose-1-phosphate cytidylyltransferase